ncbi:MAG TPA: hypothetical protein DCE18_17580, partial [Syntrophobacteraceae bacterium]|nr:hypothetical protein [Syntrophobacteraceae bacterium]
FLDFRSLIARRTFCRQEVLLNQRFSHDVYQGMVAIHRDSSGRFSLEGPGLEVEYAVKMRQLDESWCLKERLKRRLATATDLKALGRALAKFYEGAARTSEIDHFGQAEVIGFNVEENFRQIEPFAGELLDAEKLALVRTVSRSFLERWQPLFARRVTAGRIRDGHGDLRSDHVYFHRGIQIIDCIEFNDRFRYGDVSSDLAFLIMDLDHRRRSALGRLLLAAYADAASDPEVYILLDFYAAYRAMVMVKVHCLRYGGISPNDVALQSALGREARRYLEQAYRYAVRFSRPTLWVFCGLPASGKSTLARELSRVYGHVLFQSDAVRKEAFGKGVQQGEGVGFGEGIYRPEITALVYGQLLALAQEELKHGRSVILDATYGQRKWRRDAQQLADDIDANVLVVECRCTEPTLRKRLAFRERQLGLSDARLGHLPEFLSRFEAIDEVSRDRHVRLSTDNRLPTAFARLLATAYGRKCSQVVRRLGRG